MELPLVETRFSRNDFGSARQYDSLASNPLEFSNVRDKYLSCNFANNPFLFEFSESTRKRFAGNAEMSIVPAVKVVQLFVTTDDGTGEGKILYMRNVPGGCDALTPEFEEKFDAASGRFVESIQAV
jgi:hypothetical protein